MSPRKILLALASGVLAALLLRRALPSRANRRRVGRSARVEAQRSLAEEAVQAETELQAEEAQTAAVAPSASQPRLETKRPEQTVVMIADDSKVVRIKTGRLLSAYSYQVVMAEDGLDAARQIKLSAPDLLITDVDMPGMGGMELARQLRADEQTAGIPIIMITADSEALRAEARASGVNVILGKPYPEELLITEIQRLMLG